MPETPYKSTPEDRRWALLLGISYVILAIASAVMLFKIWPPTPWPTDNDLKLNPQIAKKYADCECPTPSPSPSPTPSPTPTTRVGVSATPASSGAQPSPTTSPTATPAASPTITPTPSPDNQPSPETGTSAAAAAASAEAFINIPIRIFSWCFRTSFDERLILLVIVAGMLGSFVHGATSLADYRGNDNFNKTWTWFYLLRPAIGMALALVFYFVVRGGFLTTSGGAKDINPYGIAALAGMVGMFSKQATDKLGEVFSTLFKSEQGDKQRADPLKPENAVTIQDVKPKPVPVGNADLPITITGTNFVKGAEVFANDVKLATTFDSATQLTATLPAASIAQPVTIRLKVVNPDKSQAVFDLPVS